MSDADPSPGGDGRPIVLLGLMGAGKTSVARALAAASGRSVIDNDAALAAAGHGTAARIEATSSVTNLHRLESEAFEAALRTGSGVVTAAASVLDRDDLPERLGAARAFVVWLDAPLEVLSARAAGGSHRPAARTDLDALRRQSSARGPMLERVADLRLDTTGATPEQLAGEVLRAMNDGRS